MHTPWGGETSASGDPPVGMPPVARAGSALAVTLPLPAMCSVCAWLPPARGDVGGEGRGPVKCKKGSRSSKQGVLLPLSLLPCAPAAAISAWPSPSRNSSSRESKSFADSSGDGRCCSCCCCSCCCCSRRGTGSPRPRSGAVAPPPPWLLPGWCGRLRSFSSMDCPGLVARTACCGSTPVPAPPVPPAATHAACRTPSSGGDSRAAWAGATVAAAAAEEQASAPPAANKGGGGRQRRWDSETRRRGASHLEGGEEALLLLEFWPSPSAVAGCHPYRHHHHAPAEDACSAPPGARDCGGGALLPGWPLPLQPAPPFQLPRPPPPNCCCCRCCCWPPPGGRQPAAGAFIVPAGEKRVGAAPTVVVGGAPWDALRRAQSR